MGNIIMVKVVIPEESLPQGIEGDGMGYERLLSSNVKKKKKKKHLPIKKKI